MQTYLEYRPTEFDGHIDINRDSWIVAPVGRNRDTASALELSNWEAQLKELGGESDNVEVHRFGHWACGWFEVVLVHPTMADKVEHIQDRLDSYPVLDEDLASELEFEQQAGAWDSCYRSEFRDQITRLSSYSGCRPDFESVDDKFFDALWEDVSEYLSWVSQDDCSGAILNVDEAADRLFTFGDRAGLFVRHIVNHCHKIDGRP